MILQFLVLVVHIWWT